MDANEYYLNRHLNSVASNDHLQDIADAAAIDIYVSLVEGLKNDDSIGKYQMRGVDYTPGWNMFSALNDINEKWWVPLAEAFGNTDKEEIGRIVFAAVTEQLRKEAKYQAQDKLERGDFNDRRNSR